MSKVRVKLVRKLAEMIDGVDLSGRAVGDTLHLPSQEARLLMAEEWAVPVEQKSRPARREQTISVSDRADDYRPRCRSLQPFAATARLEI